MTKEKLLCGLAVLHENRTAVLVFSQKWYRKEKYTCTCKKNAS
jgi:hypothetical protein